MTDGIALAGGGELLALGRPVVVFDTETTGASHDDRIVSLGALRLGPGLEPEAALHLVFDPGRPCHWGAFRVHGLSDDYLARQPGFAAHAEEVAAFFDGAVPAAHNLPFDLRMLGGEFARLGLEMPGEAVRFCTLRASRRRWPGEKCGLDAVLARIGLSRAGALHGAFEDAMLAAGVLRWLHGAPAVLGMPMLAPTNER